MATSSGYPFSIMICSFWINGSYVFQFTEKHYITWPDVQHNCFMANVWKLYCSKDGRPLCSFVLYVVLILPYVFPLGLDPIKLPKCLVSVFLCAWELEPFVYAYICRRCVYAHVSVKLQGLVQTWLNYYKRSYVHVFSNTRLEGQRTWWLP